MELSNATGLRCHSIKRNRGFSYRGIFAIGYLQNEVIKRIYDYSQAGIIQYWNSSDSLDRELKYLPYLRKQRRDLHLLNSFNLVPVFVVWTIGLLLAVFVEIMNQSVDMWKRRRKNCFSYYLHKVGLKVNLLIVKLFEVTKGK